ncbi:hypothetical protein GQ44DRAFT_746813 [Phaeosphaeriaceae sp. PMI808]|nr:hypothetical protein GQ44DRAFT_746813 [Phaeosphaeriaceae sp. PMI808]
MMDFIDGINVSDLFKDLNAERPTRLRREDISDMILNLPTLKAEAQSHTPTRPLTFRAHSILQNGGGFTSTTEYFQYVLVHQPNSVVGLDDAKNIYVAFKIPKALIPDLVNPKYERCKFKLICDDLGLANLIVRSKEDLTIVGLVDLEWSYVGPAQLFGSAPWWLLQDKPVNSAWDYKGDEPPKIAARYFKCLEIFIRILEEEAKMLGHKEKELSSLLHQHLRATEWAKREKEFDNTEELEAFAARKVSELDEYNDALEKREEVKAFVDSGEMTKEEFIANALCPPCSSSFVVNDEMRNDRGLFCKLRGAFVKMVNAIRVAAGHACITNFSKCTRKNRKGYFIYQACSST